MKISGRITSFVVLVCLVSAGCSLSRRPAVMPLTTSSEEAGESYLEGLALLEVNRVAEARASFERAAELDPDFALAHVGLAETAPTITGRYDSLRKAASLKAGVSEGERRMILALEAGTRGDPVMQSKHLQGLVSLYPEDTGAMARYGAFLISAGQHNRALQNLERAVALDPEYPWPYALMSAAQRSQGDFLLARESVDRYLELVPDEPVGHVVLAELLMKQGNFEESIESCEQALALDPGFVPAHLALGNNRIFLGEGDAARETFARLTEVATSDADRLLGLLWSALSYVSEGRHDEALAELQRRLELAEKTGEAPLVAEGLLRIGDVLLDAGRFDEALDRYDAAHESIRGSRLPYIVIGFAEREHIYRQTRVALAKGDMSVARAGLRQFLRKVSKDKNRRWTTRRVELRGMLALADGDLENATKFLPRADEENPRILYLGALARQRAGQNQAAKALCKRAAEFNEIDLEYAFVRTPARKLLEEF